MPGLLYLVAFIDLLSGLYFGDIENHGQEEFVKYTAKFPPLAQYDQHLLKLLYVGFRHKIAHLSHPAYVIDTAKELKRFPGIKQRMAWTICAGHRKHPLELKNLGKVRALKTQPTPWPVEYGYRFHISIRSLARDAQRTIYGPAGYLAALKADPKLLRKFCDCLEHLYPR